MSVVVVIPSRGRPDRAAEAIEAIRQTAVLVDTSVVLAVDADDPEWDRYADMAGQRRFLAGPETSLVTLRGDETGNLVKATNTVSMRIARENPDSIIGNLGDDHMTRTPGWDRIIRDTLAEPGIAYGDDLIHGQKLPSAPFISARIVLALGWYFLPTCIHLYCDDAVRELGKAIGRLHYLAGVVIEHMHPAVGKAANDEGYVRANHKRVVDHDHDAYLRWTRGPNFRADYANVMRALR